MTPLQTRVLGYLLNNQGISLNAELDSNINEYISHLSVLDAEDINDYILIAEDFSLVESRASLIALLNAYPALFNRFACVNEDATNETGDIIFVEDTATYKEFVISDYVNLTDARFSEYIINWAEKILGYGDISKYTQLLSLAQSQCQTLNSSINSAINSQNFMPLTFTNMNNLITGNFLMISSDLKSFGRDCDNLGNLIDFSEIQYLGHPLLLLRQLAKLCDGDLPIVGAKLEQQGVGIEILDFPNISDIKYLISVSRTCYEVMKTVQGVDLKDIMKLFDISYQIVDGSETFSIRPTSMADLLDLTILFPQSLLSLKTLIQEENVEIFKQGAVPNSALAPDELLDEILPVDISRTNQALAKSFLQIKNIQSQTLNTVSNAALSFETAQTLTSINSIQSAGDETLVSIIINKLSKTPNEFSLTSGTNHNFTIGDFLGSPAGITHNQQFLQLNSLLQMAPLTDWNSRWVAIKTKIDSREIDNDIKSDIDNLIDEVENFSDSEKFKSCVESIQNQIKREKINLSNATATDDQTFPVTASNDSSGVCIFAQQLGEYGKDKSYLGSAFCIESIADNTPAGESIIAAMREGRNLTILQNSNIDADNEIPNQNFEIQEAELLESTPPPIC